MDIKYNIFILYMITLEFIFVSLTTAFTSILYLFLSGYLDNYISPIISNGIGLIIDITLDYIFQSYIFLKKLNTKNNIINKFIISKIISTFSSQILFIIYIKFLNNKKINITLVRIIISSLVFFLIVFPLSKFFVFNN